MTIYNVVCFYIKRFICIKGPQFRIRKLILCWNIQEQNERLNWKHPVTKGENAKAKGGWKCLSGITMETGLGKMIPLPNSQAKVSFQRHRTRRLLTQPHLPVEPENSLSYLASRETAGVVRTEKSISGPARDYQCIIWERNWWKLTCPEKT